MNKHQAKQYQKLLEDKINELLDCQKQNVDTITDLVKQRDILVKENSELRYIAQIFKEFHEIVMSDDDAVINQFINFYRQMEKMK
ncbi:hypothetical protein [Moraxella sp. 7664LN]|uniref:hypothetical protein n=1 Tax=Moraxella sp. 7664LN TaxID=3093635 RepID=UPI002B40ABED|nr:hypothetical protein [Moraxella sp. 7664LN]